MKWGVLQYCVIRPTCVLEWAVPPSHLSLYAGPPSLRWYWIMLASIARNPGHLPGDMYMWAIQLWIRTSLFKEGQSSYKISALISASVSIAMYCLLQLYFCVSKQLSPQRPVLKLFAVKAVGMSSSPHSNRHLTFLFSVPHFLASFCVISPLYDRSRQRCELK